MLRLIEQNVGLTTICCDDRIDSSVVVEVADRHAPADPGLVEDVARDRGDVDELAADVTRQQHRLPVMELRVDAFYRVEIVPLRDQQVLPAVVVIIEES